MTRRELLAALLALPAAISAAVVKPVRASDYRVVAEEPVDEGYEPIGNWYGSFDGDGWRN